MTGIRATFLALVCGQLAHSIEEYVGRLWESFPPAMALTGMISSDREFGFLVINGALVLFGFWCYLIPVRHEWRGATGVMWAWVTIELINGVGHPAWSLSQRGYTPGLLTAPLLLVLAVTLAVQLQRRASVV